MRLTTLITGAEPSQSAVANDGFSAVPVAV
jgi:hypothetical protein